MRREEEALRLRRVIGHRLLLARTDIGLTQPAAAALIGRPKSFLSGVETGKRRIELSELNRLVDVYKARGADLTYEHAVDPFIKAGEEERAARGVYERGRGNPGWEPKR